MAVGSSFVPMNLGSSLMSSKYPKCAYCPHDEHGLPCVQSFASKLQWGGTAFEKCECLGLGRDHGEGTREGR